MERAEHMSAIRFSAAMVPAAAAPSSTIYYAGGNSFAARLCRGLGWASVLLTALLIG